MSEITYPLFLPPDDLVQKSAKEWTDREAMAYFNWMLGCLDQRVTFLLQYVEVSVDQSIESLLKQIGDKLENTLQGFDFHRETADGRRLSNVGYAIAADAGLLVAKCIIENGAGKVSWEIMRKKTSAQSFSLPVLVGFASNVELDPVAASIAQATGILRGTKKRDRWLNLYEYWAKQT